MRRQILLVISLVFFWMSGVVHAMQNLDLDFVYCHSGCKQDVFTIAKTSDGHVFPYASLRLKFDRALTDIEKSAFVDNFRILKSGKELEHLHEKISSLPAEGVHSSFNWINNQTLIYTASSLPAGNNYTILYPNNWLENNNISSFNTMSLTGNGIRIYEFFCPNEACYRKLTNAENAINAESIDQTYADMIFKDVYANKTYQDTKMRIRGHTSTWVDKKSYTVKFDSDNLFEGFQDSDGDYQGPRKKLVFIAHKVFSVSDLSTNKLMNDVARKLEKQIFGAALEADSYFALMVFNGRFWGVYNVSEHIDSGKGGWSTTKARTKVLGFNKKGKGMLHKAVFGGLEDQYSIEPKTDHEYEFLTRGNGVQTDWTETIPFNVYYKMNDFDFDFDFKVKAKSPKMKLQPDLSKSTPPSFELSGDGSGLLSVDNTETQVIVSFEQPVANNEKIEAEFNSVSDFQAYYNYIKDNRNYASIKKWFNVDSSLISMFVIKLSGSFDHGTHNRYMFSKEKNLESFIGAVQAPNENYYFDILWDGDLTFRATCAADFINGNCTRPPPLHWKIIVKSQEGRQRYIDLFNQEKEVGGVLTPKFYQQQIQSHLDALGNSIQLEELRWDRKLDYSSLRNYLKDRFSNKEFLRNKILSLKTDDYISPSIVGNLLRNNNAQEGLKHWNIIQNGGQGFGSGFYNNSVNKGFNTSYAWSIKEQTMDLGKLGMLDDNDKVLVGAEFRDVYCGNDYLFLEVELKDENHDIVKRFSTGKRKTRVPRLCVWGNGSTEKISAIINIPAGKTVRYITYRDGGKDSERWGGRYGVVINNAKVIVEKN